MKFFTREWEDGEVNSDVVDSEHERHVAEIRGRLPAPLRSLVEGGGNFWLHDAQPLALDEDSARGQVMLRLRALDYANATESVSLALEYANGELIGISPGDLQQVILDPRAQLLRSELHLSADGTFEHRFSLWSPRYFEFAIRFTDASLSMRPYSSP